MKEKIVSRFIIQIAGKPVANVTKALEFVEKKIKEHQDYKVLDSEIVEPELDKETSLYSGLLDVQVKFEDIDSLFGFILDFAPNSVDIEEPENFNFDSAYFTGFLNDISSKLLRNSNQIRMLNANLHHLKKIIEDNGLDIKTGKKIKK